MKSQRRAKETIVRVGSNASLKSAGDAANAQPGDPDFIAPKSLLKPANQLTLTDKELEEEFTRILNANNPRSAQNIARFNFKEKTYKCSPNVEHHVVHFEYDGCLVFKGDDNTDENAAGSEEARKSEAGTTTAEQGTEAGTGEGAEGAAEGLAAATSTKPKAPMRNQFNFCERAAQSQNFTTRERSTNTDPPPKKTFSASVNQWSIFDAYMDDIQSKEKAAKEKTKASKKDDEKLVLADNAHTEDVYYKNAEFKKAVTIIERMANQNTFDDIAQDFKYWDDASDEFREGKQGTLLPLWKFMYEKEKRKQITSLCWNCADLFAVGYGSYEFARQGPGMIACFTLKNPSFPEFVFHTEAGVMSLDFHPQQPFLMAVGLYDGSVLVFNLQNKSDTPIYKSARQYKHSDPVWQVSWQKDDLDENRNFFSVSSDGRVTQWTLSKNELVHTDIIHLTMSPVAGSAGALASGAAEDKLFSLEGGCCFDFHKTVEHLFVVGTEEGKIHKCSKTYSNQYLMTYEGHHMAVYSIKYNPLYSNVFLSASADWTVKLWDQDQSKPVITFDLNSPVGDVAWSPYSSTVFAAVTADGKAYIFDLDVNKYAPVCSQQVVKKAKLTHVSFNPTEPILIVGDDKGNVISLKLSPNLRRSKGKEDEPEKLEKVILVASGKSLDR